MKSSNSIEDRLRGALDELTISTPLANPEGPPDPEDESLKNVPYRRPPWTDMKALVLVSCVVALCVAGVTIGLHSQVKNHKRVTTSISTTTAPTTTVPEPVPTTTPITTPTSTAPPPTTSTMPPTTSSTTTAPPVGYTSALATWQAGADAHNYQWSSYWLQAASDLASAVNPESADTAGYATAITELRQLASLEGGGLSTPQAGEYAADLTALNEFFGTSGAYGTAY